MSDQDDKKLLKSQYDKEHYRKNIDKKRLYNQEYRKKNREKLDLNNKRWREENRERQLEKVRQYHRDNRDALKEKKKKYYEENPEKVKALRKAQWKRHYAKHKPHYKIKCNQREAKIREAVGKYTVSDINAMHLAQGGKCVYCKCCIQSGYEIDHIIPVSKGGTNDKSNIQLLCMPCNRKKGNKDPIEFMQAMRCSI